MQPQQPWYNNTRVYLELLADFLWETTSKQVELDLNAAKDRLDSDHYGLFKVEQRGIKYLPVHKVGRFYSILIFYCKSTLNLIHTLKKTF